MWKPTEVVPENKRCAGVLWLGLMAAITAFAIQIIVKTIQERLNPNTSYELSDAKYQFPDVYVCLEPTQGCDYETDIAENCLHRFGVEAYGEFHSSNITGFVDESDGDACVGFPLSTFDVGSGDHDRENSTAAWIEMHWITSMGTQDVTFYTQAVDVFLWDEETQQPSSAIYVPYSRLVNGSYEERDLHTTSLGIGLTKKTFLDKPEERIYSALTISTVVSWESELGTVFTSTSSDSETSTSGQLRRRRRQRRRLYRRGRRRLDTEESEDSSSSSTLEGSEDSSSLSNLDELFEAGFVLGSLHLEITEASLSLSTLKEINPLNVLNIFGNIGGLWEILMILWGLVFVSSLRESPHLRVRSVTEPFRALGTRVKSLSDPRRKDDQEGSEAPSEAEANKRPSWNGRGSGPSQLP